MKKLLLLLAFLPGAVCHAEDAPPITQGVAPFLSLMADSENFRSEKLGAAYYPWYENGEHFTGLRVTKDYFSQDTWKREGQHFSLVTRNVAPRTGMGYHIDLGGSSQGGHQLLTTDSGWSRRLAESTGVDLFINRDWVESRKALDNGISHTFGGGSFEQQLTDRLTFVGTLGAQSFSDGNFRPHLRGRLIYNLLPDYGVTAQARYRLFTSSKENVGGNYFNPDRYSEEMLLLGMRRRVEAWTFYGLAGIGREHVDSAPAETTRLLSLEATSPIAGQLFLRTRADYNRSAGVNGPSYTSHSLQSELVFAY
jgi:hypothetical protein